MLETEFGAAIFDLDGVLVDTAGYHYRAWKRLAEELGFEFRERDNERLKGVSRMRSLEILLEVGNVCVLEADKPALAARKNRWYVEQLETLDQSALLPGALACLTALSDGGIPVALASASKNAGVVITRLQIAQLFRYVVDAAAIANAKPSPDIFLDAARGLDVMPATAVVFEDAPAGVDGAHAAGMRAVGIGSTEALSAADLVVPDLSRCGFRCGGGHFALVGPGTGRN